MKFISLKWIAMMTFGFLNVKNVDDFSELPTI
jgi:hypothetical protein